VHRFKPGLPMKELQKRQALWWLSWNQIPAHLVALGQVLQILTEVQINPHLDN
jgi:hypothetical protein